MWWYAVILAVIALLLVGWIANSVRLAGKNKNLARRSPRLNRHDEREVDESNRPASRSGPGTPKSTEPQPRPAAPPPPEQRP